MSKNGKKIISKSVSENKRTISKRHSTDNENVVWRFDWIDKSGKFAFNLDRTDFLCREVLEKMISYNSMTWTEVKMQTHDHRGKTKHHFLDYDGISKEGKERISEKHLEDYTDSIFSFSLMNILRIIGIRKDQYFYAIWYDPNHQFYPVKK